MTQSQAAPADTRLKVRLGDLGLAPENLRCKEPADEGVARLADTIRAAGLIYPPIVRPGRRGEQPYMVLDGRRRRFALLRLVEAGHLTLDHEVGCVLAEGKAAQAAAAVLANTEQAPVHLADVIVAIGKLRKSKMDTAAIAAALGYDELEIKRLEALSALHPDVLKAFRQGRLTLRQVRLFARLPDRKRQGELAQTALAGYFHDYQLQALVNGSRVTIEDPRFALAGLTRYGERGGRLESDLFGETPDVVLDTDLLAELWRERAGRFVEALGAEGLTVYLGEDRGYRAPDGLFSLPYVHPASLTEAGRSAYAAARERMDAAADALDGVDAADEAHDSLVADLIAARLAFARASIRDGAIEAVLLSPGRTGGIEASFYWRPGEPEDAPDEADDAEEEDERAGFGWSRDIETPSVEVDVAGVSHVLHETRTDIATRGLMRDLADHPGAALTALVAQLFKHLALRDHVTCEQSALAVTAAAYRWGQTPTVEGLDAEVRARLEARRSAYRESGLRPIAYVDGLPHGEKMALLAELTALALDLRESRTSAVREAARVEAAEIAALCGADLAQHWTPDARFLAAHSKAQLLEMLADMGVEDDRVRTLKKAELAAVVQEAAAERRWAPRTVRWTGDEPSTEGGPDGAVQPADGQAAAAA
jgi:ParB family chromosome partitioning protein